MIIITRKITRESENILFHFQQPPTEKLVIFGKYYAEKFMHTGKVFPAERLFSEDNLSVLVIMKWLNKEAYQEFLCDSICWDAVKYIKTYETVNGQCGKIVSIEES